MNNELEQFLQIVKEQEERKSRCINLIASENVISDGASKLQSSLLSNRYILDDFPNNKGLFLVKKRLDRLLGRLFSAKYVNTSPLSGMNCMELIIGSLSKNGDNIYILSPEDGGHMATKEIGALHHLKINYIPYDRKNNVVDILKTKKAFEKNKPNLVYLDNTIICFYSNIKELKKCTVKYNAPLIFDGSHVLGLIAGKAFPNPLNDGADILNGSTHKTFFGVQKGVILSNDKKLMDKIAILSKDYISSVHTGSLISLYLSSLEMEKYGVEYASQVVKNAKALAKELQIRGIDIATKSCGFTDTHQVWIDTGKINSLEIYKKLANCNINVNLIRIPAIKKLGLRLGTAEVTRLGMKEGEMSIIAGLIAETIKGGSAIYSIKKRVVDFCGQFKKIYFTLDCSGGNNDFIDQQRFKQHKVLIKNYQKKYEQVASKYVKDYFQKIPGFRGMILRGGVGRGTADEFSDIDFTCIFEGDIRKISLKYSLKKGMHLYNGLMFSGRYISLDEFGKNEWSEKMKHAYSYVRFVFCTEAVKKIIAEKIRISNKEQIRRVVANIIELGEICKVYEKYRGFEMFSEIYKNYHRAEIISANLEIDRAIKYLKNVVFDLNKMHYPEEKSYYTRFFSDLAIKPKGFDEKIFKIMEMPRNRSVLNVKISMLVSLSRELIDFCESKLSLPNSIYKYLMSN